MSTDEAMFRRLSIVGNECAHCGTVMGEPLRCAGCGWVDPLTRRPSPDQPAAGVGGAPE